jgi:serine/threonine protein kinase
MYESKHERDALFSATNGKFVEVRLLNEIPTGFGWAVLVNDYFNKPCVAKLPNSLAATAELRNEAEILAKIRELEHPNLVKLRDVEKCQLNWQGSVEERLFLVLQYGGVNLRTKLGKLGIRRAKGGDEFTYHGGKPLPLDEWFHIALQVADGLRALHEFELQPGEHIVHRDIKPENILLDKEGRIRITDFGISRVIERLTQSFTVGGTPPYLAPEYLRGRINASCDVYSFGIVLYEMATGAYPFQCQEDKLWELPEAPHRINSEIPEPVSRVILRMLDFDSHAPRGEETRNRFQSGGQVWEELQRCKRRLFPVPVQYERIASSAGAMHLYLDTVTRQPARVLLYELSRKELAQFRLAAHVVLNVTGFVTPLRLFDVENLIGIVTPVVPWDSPQEVVADATTQVYSPASSCVLSAPKRVRPLLPGLVRDVAADQELRKIADLADVLQPLHDAGIFHGTLTPFTAVWHDGQWIVDDVWVQALVGSCELSSICAPDDPVLGCLAPEMTGWNLLPKIHTDVYGLGTLAYAALTGRTPVRPQVAQQEAAPSALWWPDDVPPRWRAMIERALAFNPLERYASVQEFAAQLRTCRWGDEWMAAALERIRRLHAAGQTVEAYDGLDAAQKKDPGNPRIHHVRAELFLADGSPEFALEENLIAYNIDPQADVCLLHARCLVALNRSSDAERYVRECLHLGENADAFRLLAKCLAEQGRLDEAAAQEQRAARLAPTVSSAAVPDRHESATKHD